MTKYRVTIKFTKLAIPNIVEFDNKSMAEEYREQMESENLNVRWTTIEEVKA